MKNETKQWKAINLEYSFQIGKAEGVYLNASHRHKGIWIQSTSGMPCLRPPAKDPFIPSINIKHGTQGQTVCQTGKSMWQSKGLTSINIFIQKNASYSYRLVLKNMEVTTAKTAADNHTQPTKKVNQGGRDYFALEMVTGSNSTNYEIDHTGSPPLIAI